MTSDPLLPLEPPDTRAGEYTSPARQQFAPVTPAPAPDLASTQLATLSYGVDLYERNGWFADGTVSFMILKALELGFREDLKFAGRYPLVRQGGRLRGAYCFGHPASDAAKGARWFARILKDSGWDRRDQVVLDHEVADGKSPAYCAKWAQDFCGTADAELGIPHGSTVVYSYLSFITDGFCAGLGNRPLWLAHPQPAGSPFPADLGPWTGKKIPLLQYTVTSIDWDCSPMTPSDLKVWWERNYQPAGPVRHVLTGTTLAKFARSRGTTVEHVVDVSARHLDAAGKDKLLTYLAQGSWRFGANSGARLPVPASGLTVWTEKP